MNRTKTELNEYKSLVGSEIGHSEWITISQKMIDDLQDKRIKENQDAINKLKKRG